MKKSLSALAFGSLCLGIAEFVMVAILPYVAHEFQISIPVAGHLVSAYAIGVCVGAPMLMFLSKYQLKHILMVLTLVMLTGGLMALFAPSYGFMLLARFVSGLPHGAFYGVAAIVAEKLADKGKGTQAVALMVAGMTVANLFGIPLCTSLSARFSWHYPFLLVSLIALAAFFAIWRWVPHVEKVEQRSFKSQFGFLKTLPPWLIIGATLCCNAAVLCWYSYVNPYLTVVTGFDESSVPWLMALAGLGMVAGNLLGGRLADRYSPGRVVAVTLVLLIMTMTLIYFCGETKWLSALLLTLCTAAMIAISSPVQISIIRFAKGGELLGMACLQIAFNTGNALGAFVGGRPIEAGLGYNTPGLVALPFALVGLTLALFFMRGFEKRV